MINSKQIKNSFIKGLKLGEDKNERELKPWEKKVQKIAGKISDVLDNIPILWRIQFFDDLEMFTIDYSLNCLFDRIWRIISLHQFRYRFGMGIDYFKKGYNSNDFDSHSALDIFLWKLGRLEKVISKHDRHFGAEEDAKQIREAIRLFERVIEDDYLDEFEALVAEKYGDNIHYTASTRGIFGFTNKNKGPFKSKHVGSIMKNFREEWTPELDKEIDKAERAMYRKAHNKRMREWKKALNIIEKDFFAWWD